MYRDKDLLKLAENQPCILQALDDCMGESDTTVSAHSNQLKHGKGKGIKAEDCYTIWACAKCHAWLDQGGGTKQDKHLLFNERFPYQVFEWKQIYLDPLQKPWKREAAERVLKYLEVFFE
jgi:hypothetical protein